MLIVIGDFFATHKRKIFLTILKIYLAAVGLAAAVLGQAAIHGAARDVLPGWPTAVLILVAPLAFSIALHVVAACILAVRLSRAAGLRVADYVKTDTYEQHGKATMRVILG